MSSVGNDEIRHQILEILYKAALERPGSPDVSRERMKEILQVTVERMDFNMLYLSQKGLVNIQTVMATPWISAEITAFGIDVVENKEEYEDEFPFIQTTIQQIRGPIYGTVIQAVESQVNFSQQLTNVFQQARNTIETKTEIAMALKEEVKQHLNLLEEELKKEEPDAGKIQRLWKWLKTNANWVVPTLAEVVIEGLRRALG